MTPTPTGTPTHTPTPTPTDAPVSFDCVNTLGVAKEECEALVSLYNSTNGAAWADHTNWLEQPKVCTWFGVECGDEGVTGLRLGGNQLQGTIAPLLWQLQALRVLELGGNKLAGGLPQELSSLGKLAELDISQNAGLSGSVPMKFTALSLRRFWYDQTGLCEPPEEAFTEWLSGITDIRRTGVACFVCASPRLESPRGSVMRWSLSTTARTAPPGRTTPTGWSSRRSAPGSVSNAAMRA